jgi:DNA-binding transcriptional MerR regulator/methylmalonyl-CoA mutase cobalamin-binding subunit
MPKIQQTTRAQAENGTELFPISTVSKLTGINSITLRAWERRYDLVNPVRTDSGHRLYTQDDIDLINRVVGLLEKGMRIGQVKDELISREGRRGTPGAEQGPWSDFQGRMTAAIIRFDEDSLELTYNEALSLYSVNEVTGKLLTPLLAQLGERWESGLGSIAEEHFFGLYLRNKLGARFHHRHRNNTGPRLMVACLPGELHEIGLLLFALAAHERGFRLVLLGANLPLQEIPAAARQARCDAIVLSGSVEPSAEVLAADLGALTGETDLPVLVGGPVSVSRCDAVLAAGADPLGIDLERALKRLGEIVERKPGPGGI